MTDINTCEGHAPASETPSNADLVEVFEQYRKMLAGRSPRSQWLGPLAHLTLPLEAVERLLVALKSSRAASETPTRQVRTNSPEHFAMLRDGWITAEMDGNTAIVARPLPASETGQASAWQPMESAPKDGTQILVAIAGSIDGEQHVAHWHAPWNCYLAYPRIERKWTHWMPLPLAPSEDETTK